MEDMGPSHAVDLLRRLVAVSETALDAVGAFETDHDQGTFASIAVLRLDQFLDTYNKTPIYRYLKRFENSNAESRADGVQHYGRHRRAF